MRGQYWIVALLLLPVILLSGCGPSTPTVTAGGAGGGSGGGTSYAQLPPVSGTYTPGLTVVGTGTAEAEPDMAYLTLGVDIKAEDAAVVVADASGRMERILATLEAAGLAKTDIRTAGYNLWVEQRYDPQTGMPTGVVDYHVIHTVRVTLRDLSKVGTVLSAAVEAGANTVQEVSFSVAEPEKLTADARQKAVADAQERAQEMADALGLALGKILSVSESSGWISAPYYYDRGIGGGGYAAVPEVPLPAGSFSVSVSVVLIYELP